MCEEERVQCVNRRECSEGGSVVCEGESVVCEEERVWCVKRRECGV